MSRGEIRVTISSDQDIVLARQKGRSLALELGFSSGDATLIATAISELARNIVSYAIKGEVALKGIQGSNRVGILVIASDNGPGRWGPRGHPILRFFQRGGESAGVAADTCERHCRCAVAGEDKCCLVIVQGDTQSKHRIFINLGALIL